MWQRCCIRGKYLLKSPPCLIPACLQCLLKMFLANFSYLKRCKYVLVRCFNVSFDLYYKHLFKELISRVTLMEVYVQKQKALANTEL